MPRNKTSRSELRETASEICIYKFLDYHVYLERLFQNHKKKKNAYSMEKFSQDLGLKTLNSMYLVLTRRRKMTPKVADAIITSLNLKKNTRTYFLTLAAFNNDTDPQQKDIHFSKLMKIASAETPSSMDQTLAQYFENWLNPVIRELAARADFTADPIWIQSKLAFVVRLNKIRTSLDFLKEHGFIRFNPTLKRYEQGDMELIFSGRELNNLALVRYHQIFIQKSIEAIALIPQKRRDFMTQTASIPETRLGDVKKLVEETMEKIHKIETGSQGPKQVFQINIQVFPFTKE